MKTFAAVMVTLLIACRSPLCADTALAWIDWHHEGDYSSTTLAYFTDNNAEFWAHCLDSDSPSYEAGQFWTSTVLDISFYAGGYLAWAPKQGELFLEPFVIAQKKLSDLTLKTCQGVYLPLNGGGTTWFSGDTSAMLDINDKFSLGIGGHWWGENAHFGPEVVAKCGSITYQIRVCPWGDAGTTNQARIYYGF